MSEPVTYRVSLVALPAEEPPEVRVRQLLKIALRRFRLRCVEVEETKPEKEAEG